MMHKSIAKILVVMTKGEIGGAQEFVQSLVELTRTEEFLMVVGCGEMGAVTDTLVQKGISVIEFEHLQRANNPFAIMPFIWELKRYLDVTPTDILHLNTTNTLPGALAAKLSRSKPKVCYTFHGLSVLHPRYKAWRGVKYLYFLFFLFFGRFVDCAVFVCQNDFCEPIARAMKCRRLIMNGIRRPAFLSRSESRMALGNRLGADLLGVPLIGSIGRLAYPKNYEFFIDAFELIRQQVPGVKAVLVGDGPARRAYQERAQHRGVSNDILFSGTILGAATLLRAFDLFVLTSHYEGMPLSLLEAIWAGVPSVAPAIGGISEILPVSQIYPPDDLETFVTKCVETIKSSSAQHVAAIPWTSADEMSRAYANLYRDLLRV